MILCVIPMKDGHVLCPKLYESLLKQTVDIVIMPITRPPLHGSRTLLMTETCSCAKWFHRE